MFKIKSVSFQNLLFYDDIVIHKEKVNFLTGPSGCGKSTLFKLLNHTLNYSSGEIYYKGLSITQYDTIQLRKEVKLISQTPFLFPGTIEQNFQLFHSYCSKNEFSKDQIQFFLQLLEIVLPLDTDYSILSGGQKQRVYLAICLSIPSSALLLDEPTASLDYDLSVRVLQNIIHYSKEHKITLCIISHDAKLVSLFSEHTIQIQGGNHDE